MNKVQYTCKVISNKKITSKFYHICIDAPVIVKKANPGQFVNLRIENGNEPFLRRPFSIYRADRYLELFYEVLGTGTKKLSLKQKNDKVDILGPLGNSFEMPSKKIKQAVMIAGGIGVAPFMMLSDKLKARKDLNLILLYGGRTKEHTFNMSEFRKNGCKVFVSTDDGSVGVKGRVSSLYKNIDTDCGTTFIYTCGPKPMMASVKDFAVNHGIEGEASCEEVMACGLGICLGCAIKLASGMKTVCFDGPVFDLKEINF